MAMLRFHWDFFGPDAATTAEHHLKHVVEFCARAGIAEQKHWVTRLAAQATATLECDDQHLALMRDSLRPKRAERVLE